MWLERMSVLWEMAVAIKLERKVQNYRGSLARV